MRGFIVSEHMERWPQGLADLVAVGKLIFRESVAEGLASAPQAFIGLLKRAEFWQTGGEAAWLLTNKGR